MTSRNRGQHYCFLFGTYWVHSLNRRQLILTDHSWFPSVRQGKRKNNASTHLTTTPSSLLPVHHSFIHCSSCRFVISDPQSVFVVKFLNSFFVTVAPMLLYFCLYSHSWIIGLTCSLLLVHTITSLCWKFNSFPLSTNFLTRFSIVIGTLFTRHSVEVLKSYSKGENGHCSTDNGNMDCRSTMEGKLTLPRSKAGQH